MTPEKQRIAIAEACGLIFEDNEYETAWPKSRKYRAGGWYKGEIFVGDIPDYLNNLNAMHEAEKLLNDQQWLLYLQEICRGTNTTWRVNISAVAMPIVSMRQAMTATAAQRAEAFLRTLNLWKEDTPVSEDRKASTGS